jgi:hypothetical protein
MLDLDSGLLLVSLLGVWEFSGMAPGTVMERIDRCHSGKMNVCWMSGSEDAVE